MEFVRSPKKRTFIFMFDGFFGSLVSGAASLAGSIIDAQSAKEINQEQIDYAREAREDEQVFNHDEAQIARDYNTEMSNTAYQRQRADLESAGYNPLLAVNSGGASTPSSAAAHAGGSSIPSLNVPKSGIGDAVNSALQAIRTFNDAELNDARKGMLESSKAIADIQKEFSISDTNMRRVDNAARFEAMTGVQCSDVNSVLSYAGVSRERFNDLVSMYKEQIRVGKYMPALNAVGETVGIIKDGASAFQSFKGKSAPVINKTTNFYQ